MAENVLIKGPIEVQPDSKERVAYDLAVRIAQNEKDQPRDRKYWLTLFRQCHKAVSDHGLDSILRAD